MEFLTLLSYGDSGWGDELLLGLGVTLALALATFPIAVVLSFAVCWAKVSPYRPVRIAAQIHTTVFKTLPEILTLLILYYQSQALINWATDWIAPGARLSVSPFLAGLIALSLVISAYGSEVVRAALNAIGKGQTEAAQSLGLSPCQTFRLVILPQMWRHAIPGFGNLWVILLKDTSLVSIIALSDLVHIATLAINTTREPFFFYLVIGAIYIALVAVSAWLQKGLERRASKGFARVETGDA
ncbi:ABC transporter permease [Roseovarius sp. M141]|uniref:ABC transporter permease n=1 Tax=Roseovarius sp. M141 TaxID=2583806 RepID=UPI0020CF0F83|nr:ABC transporter permease subunit [Roseovarius sp. M141]MCQ0092440.1 ABC transporter permease subunit [Roseovarius sp. M141]